ncbi:MAG: hypothetical protein ABIT38_06300, partial [Gemmatimonadaceae bacterium]
MQVIRLAMSTWSRFASSVVLCALASCSAERTAVPPLVPRIVVHAVLDPTNAEQVIFVERTHTDSSNARATVSARD